MAQTHKQQSVPKQLQTAEELFEATFNQAAIAMSIVNLDGSWERVNEVYPKMLGYTRAELLTKTFLDITHPDDRAGDVEIGKKLLAGSIKSYTREKRYLRKDGSVLWGIITATGVYDAKGKLLYVVATVQDITERKQYETDLTYQKALFQAQNDATPDAILVVSPEGKMLYYNQSFIDIWHMPQKIIDSKDDKAALKHAMSQVVDPEAFIKRVEYLYQYPDEISHEEMTLKDGRVVERYGVPVRGTDDSYFGWTWYFRDITRRKQAEAELKQQSELTKIITDNATTGLLIMDDQQRCTFMNPAAEEITGFTFEEVLASDKPLHDIVHHKRPDGSTYPMMECPIDRALPTQNQTKGEDVFVKPDGSMYPVAFTASPIVRGSKPIGTVIELRDTTHEKAVEREIKQLNRDLEERVDVRTQELTAANKELARSNVELQDFAYVASHDLQEPLRKIAAFSNLLETDYKDVLPKEAHRYIHGLQKSSARMRTLISDLLTYSRVTTQAQPFEVVDLNVIIKDVVEDLQVRIDDTNAEVHVDELCTLEGDPLQLRLLLQNFISNALKYSREGVPPVIYVTGKQTKEHCTVGVQDNGIGFNEAYVDKIFTIFQRLHGRNEYEGTGIGLAICKKIVDRHNGSIKVISTEGKGSTFTVTLPKKQPVQVLPSQGDVV
ncbi:MAG TPA: PAS domain S-box protein [Candidatus Limnocylindrales bacterium]|nr:PAS domain S-box protein [Candidatus Limnocylindrales bacterium]